MKKPGNFRKGKKAFKRGVKNKLFNRYEIYLLRVQAWRKAKLKIIQAGIVSMMGAAQIEMIRQAPIPKYPDGGIIISSEQRNDAIQSKELAIAEVLINTTKAVQQILSE